MERRARAAGHDTTSGDSGDWAGRVPTSLFWNNTPSLLLTFAVRAPPLGLLVPLLNSEKLVLEQHSLTFADFCCLRPPPRGLLPVPVLNSEQLVWEQHSFTFAAFCCLRPPPAAAAGGGAEFREASFGATLLHFC